MGTEGWVSKPALFRPVKNWLSGFVHRRGVGPMVAGASTTGDQALIAAFKQGRYALIATDDAKLIRILRSTGIPFMVPALLIHALHEKGEIDRETALDWLNKLSAFISDEEYSVTKLLLEERA